MQPHTIINDPDPIDPGEIFKKLHLEHIKHLIRVLEHNFNRGHSLVLRCYRQRIDDVYESVTANRRVCKRFNLLYGTLGLIHSITSHSCILTMPANHWCSLQKKAEEDATCEAKFTAAIQAIKEKKIKNLHTAAVQFKVPYDTLCQWALNLTKPHLKPTKPTITH